MLDEAERRPEACLHVEAPQPPEVVAGMSLDELRALHNAMAGDARVTDATGKAKKVRVDQHTLATVVASHPGGTPEAVAKWESLTVAWLRDTYGNRLASIVRHTDEGHPHVHAYLLPDVGEMRARALHPGVQAKATAKAESSASGDDAKTANAKGDRAYKAAMRSWQDGYWQAVGLPCGLARIGPGRRRLSRAEWQAEQAQVERVASLQPVLAQVDRAEACIYRGRAAVADLWDQVAHAKAEKDAAVRATIEAVSQADQVAREARLQATGMVAKAKREARAIVARARKEADRFRRLGAVLGGLVQGVLGASPSKVEALVRANERERAVGEVQAVYVELRDLRASLRESERARAELVDTVREVATERDALLFQSSRQYRGARTLGPK